MGLSNIYIPAEATRIRFQHQLFFREMERLVPEEVAIEDISCVLDISCGPGVWAIEMARTYPHLHIVGVDGNEGMITIAQEDAQIIPSQHLDFEIGCPVDGLRFADNTFDLIHILCPSANIIKYDSEKSMRELLRVLKPDGWIHLLDFEFGATSSAALEELLTRVRTAYKRAGIAFATEVLAPTFAIFYPRFLTQSGCTEVRYALYPLDLGNQHNFLGRDYVYATFAADQSILALLTQIGEMSKEDVSTLIDQVRKEVRQLDYCSIGMLFSVVGRKPSWSS